MPTIEHGSVASAPVEFIPSDTARQPEDGIGLCLSGGGYRAMLFHLGALWRLHDAKLLPRLKRVSSVSGGSITAAVLGLWMAEVERDATKAGLFGEKVVDPLRRLARRTIDRRAIAVGLLTPGSIGDKVVNQYRRHLLGDKKLKDLPDGVRFVINATNVQSGALWRFSKPYMGDWRVGLIEHPDLQLAEAVAASSAFPPALSPVELELDHDNYKPGSGAELQQRPFTTDVVLTDGGVYDNLGLETVWKNYTTVLASNGGGRLEVEEDPKRDWARHSYRVLSLIDSQVRSLRVRQLVASFKAKPGEASRRLGAYWGIRTNIADYDLADALPCPPERTLELALTPTRLKALDDRLQERIINWGYAVCDAAIRKWLDPTLQRPTNFPYPKVKV